MSRSLQLPYEAPPSPRWRAWLNDLVPARESFTEFCFQAAHRLGAVSLFAIVAAWVLLYRGQSYQWPAAIAFASSDVAFCSAILARLLTTTRARRGEALGAMVFNLVILVSSLQLMFISRLPVIRAAVAGFFSPS